MNGYCDGAIAPRSVPGMTGDSEAASAAEALLSDSDAALLGVLQMLWQGIYTIGYDQAGGWWASRDGVVGHLLTAKNVADLGLALVADHGPGQ